MKYLKWFFLLLKAIILRKNTYNISFTKECDNLWYVDFPNWPLSHENLQMVAGADDLLNRLNDGSNHISLIVSTLKFNCDLELKKVHSSLTKGAFYTLETPLIGWENPTSIRRKEIWLCPVTLTVLGHYPEFIYIKQTNPESE